MQKSRERWPIMTKILIKIDPKLTQIFELSEDTKTLIITVFHVFETLGREDVKRVKSGLPCWLTVKNLSPDAGDAASIPALRRSHQP